VTVAEAADDPYQRAAAADPTSESGDELPPTVDLPSTMPSGLDPQHPDPTVETPVAPIERYALVRMVGVGSTARIFSARQTALDREVAVRVMHPEGIAHLGIDDRAAFFEARARAASRLIHPNIAPVYDYATGADGLPYRVEAFLPGQTLLQRLKAERCIDPAETAHIGARLASALAAAHAADVVHLNLKPGRVILQPRPGLGSNPAIFGFGFGRADLESLLGGGRRYGTPAYMAPEQLDGQHGMAADVYGLGTVLFRMTTGLLPFWGQSVDALSEAKAAGAPPLPQQNMRGTAVPEALRATVADMLKTRADDRPVAAEVAARLAALG